MFMRRGRRADVTHGGFSPWVFVRRMAFAERPEYPSFQW